MNRTIKIDENMNTVEPIRSKKDLKKVERMLRKRSIRYYLIFKLGINCGLRISDILGLNVADVKNKDYIDIIEQKTHKQKKFPINKLLKPMLDLFTRNRKDDEPLFKSVFGNRLERTHCYRVLSYACEKAGLKFKVGTHTMRKTFGYHHYKRFKDVAILQKIFNHSTPAITLRYIGIDQDIIDQSYKNFSI